jgi:hypothetical protein
VIGQYDNPRGWMVLPETFNLAAGIARMIAAVNDQQDGAIGRQVRGRKLVYA